MFDPLSIADEAIAMKHRVNPRDGQLTVSITLKGGIGPEVTFDLATLFDNLGEAEDTVRKMRRWMADHLDAAVLPYIDAPGDY